MKKDDDQKALEAEIDAQILLLKRLLAERYDRRGPVRPHEPEQRSGFDRRARSAPVKE